MFKSVIGPGLIVAATLLASAASAQIVAPATSASPVPGPFEAYMVKPVKPGLFMIVGNGGNVTVRVASDGVIVVDTKNPGEQQYGELVKAIAGLSGQPVKDVFITHVHNDHSGNTGRFEAAGATLIATDGEKALLATYAPAPTTPRSAAPTVAFATQYKVTLKGAAVEAYHFNPAHTGGDAIVYFADLKAIAMGDEVSALPNIDYPDGGSALGWQKNLAEVAKLDFDTVIPGHGDDPLTRAQFDDWRRKWDTLIERARALVKAGTPKALLMSKLKTDDLGWKINNPQWNIPARVDAFYAEMSK